MEICIYREYISHLQKGLAIARSRDVTYKLEINDFFRPKFCLIVEKIPINCVSSLTREIRREIFWMQICSLTRATIRRRNSLRTKDNYRR